MGGKGSGRPRKLTPTQEDEAAANYRTGRLSVAQVGHMYGVSRGTLMRAITRAWTRESEGAGHEAIPMGQTAGAPSAPRGADAEG
jgi:hypothetical protein